MKVVSIDSSANTYKVTMVDEIARIAQVLRAFLVSTGIGARVCLAEQEAPMCAFENRFCSLLRVVRPSPCVAMSRVLTRVREPKTRMRRCPAGMEHGILRPSAHGGSSRWIEFGQVFLAPPRPEDFEALLARFPEWRRAGSPGQLKDAFFSTPVITREQLDAGREVLRVVVLELSRLSPPEEMVSLRTDPVEKVKAYVRENLAEVIRLSDVAEHVRWSPAHLCREFKRRTGQTLGQCIAHARSERAKRLLESGQTSVTEIAFAAGFQSVRQFNHIFKSTSGLTPSEYRRTLRPGEER